MKKVLSIVLVVVMFLLCVPLTASAENTQLFSFELSVDGSDTKEVQTGDVITVLLRLKRTDSAEAYMMYAMQDEILYDSDFFELIEGSIVLAENITTTDIGLRDNHRAFYMNYLSMSDGEQWAADMLIGSFQLRVVGTSGVTRITNNNYLVSTSDGRESYPCQVNEVTIILSTECIVRFESNGGSEIEEQKVLFGETVVKPEDPTRDGYIFDGWYRDIDKTKSWDFDNDTVSGNMSLYAKWVQVPGGISPTEDTDNNGNTLDWLILLVIVVLLLILIMLPKCKVTFISMGGSEIKTRYVMKNRTISAPKMPKKGGAVFVGWYRDEFCKIPWKFSEDKVTEDTTLYAKWN